MPEQIFLYRRVIAIALALLAVGFAVSRNAPANQSLFEQPRNLDEFVKQVTAASYEISCEDSAGSGWGYRTVEDGKTYEYVITNFHVVKFCIVNQTARVTRPDGVTAPSKIMAYKNVDATPGDWQQEVDFAVLKFPVKLDAPLTKIAKDQPRGSWVMMSSFPGLVEYFSEHQIVTGIISGKTEQWGYTTTAGANPGSSGGVIVNSRGEVVGTLYATWSPQERDAVSLFLDNEELMKLIDKAIQIEKSEGDS